jgi:hypothetical protein
MTARTVEEAIRQVGRESFMECCQARLALYEQKYGPVGDRCMTLTCEDFLCVNPDHVQLEEQK